MQADQTTLYKMMRGPKQQFEIPLYQRRYSWTDKQRRQLWLDVLRASKLQGEKKHFTGSVVYMGVPGQAGALRQFRLVDGQQRLTSAHLMLLALAEYLDAHPDEAQKLGRTGQEIRDTFLLNPGEEKDEQFKLQLNHADNPVLKEMLSGTYQRPQGKEVHETELMRGLQFFRDRFAEAGVDAAAIWEGFKRLEVVGIVLEEGTDDIGVVFESLNSTGKALTQADLIRNNVLMGKTRDDQKEITKEFWHPMELRFAEAEEGAFDRFMRDYLTLRTRTLPNEGDVYLTFKAYRQQQNVMTVVKDVKKASELYLELLNPTNSSDAVKLALTDLSRLNLSVINPFLLELLEDRQSGVLTDDQLEKALRVVESFLVRRAVTGERTAPLNKFFATLGHTLQKDDYVRSLERALVRFQDNNQDGFPDNFVFEQRLKDATLYGKAVCKPLLIRLERGQNTKETFGGILTIEHIMPQSPGDAWATALGKTTGDDKTWRVDHERLVHTLGNLTLTGYNSELGNLSFEEKKNLPMKPGDTEESAIRKGYKYSRLLLTRDLADKANWNQAEIAARAEALAKRAIELYPYPQFTDEEIAALRAEGRQRAKTKTVDRLLDGAGLQLRQLFEAVDSRLKALGDDEAVKVTSTATRGYVAYKVLTNFCDVQVQTGQNALKCALNAPLDQLDDPLGLVRDVSQIGHFGNGPAEVTLTLDSDLEAFLELAEQALKYQLARQTVASPSNSDDPVDFSHLPAPGQQALEELGEWAVSVGASIKDNQNYRALRDRRVFAELYPRQNGLHVAVKAAPDELSGHELQGWTQRGAWLYRTVDNPVELQAAWPVIRAGHAQQLLGATGPQPTSGISNEQRKAARKLFDACLDAASDIGPDVQGIPTQKSAKFMVGGREFARIYSSVNVAGTVGLRLNLRPDELQNPQSLGGIVEAGDETAGFVKGHFVVAGTSMDDYPAMLALAKEAYAAFKSGEEGSDS